MSFWGTFCLGQLLLGTAQAVEWPDLSEVTEVSTSKSKDHAIIIALEEYQNLNSIRNASLNAQDWGRYFVDGLGLAPSQVSMVLNSDATKSRVLGDIKRHARKLKGDGRLWVVYIGHGVTMFDDQQAALLPYYTPSTAKELYASAIQMEEIAEALGDKDDRSIFLFDTAFNAKDRQGVALIDSIPHQEGVLPQISTKATILSAVSQGEMAGNLVENGRPAFSYLVLGALRGWGDTDQDGWMNLLESVEYADMVLGAQTTVVQGRMRRQKISKAMEEGPRLVAERPQMTPVDPMSLVPEGMLSENVSLESLLKELSQQRAYEVQIQQEIDEQVAGIREAAAKHWRKVRTFAEKRVDDPARVAVYAFLREYQHVVIQVQGREFEVDIPEVQLARQLLSQLATPSVHNVKFTWIPDGTFEMGNAQVSSVQHSVRLSHSFYMSTTEVTQQLYHAILNENPSVVQGDDYPVTNVSWFDAVRFANALSEFEGLETCYDIKKEMVSLPAGTNCLGYRLPTEAEWEYSARSTNRTPFSGGDRISKVGWIDSNSGGEVHFVGQKSANEFGLYDMSGNVSEWVWDWYGDYQISDSLDPLGSTKGLYRVQRGGSVTNPVLDSRVDARHPAEPSYSSPFQGFRIVRTVPDM